MENKYYKPESFEFCIGFEFEWFDDTDCTWNKKKIESSIDLCYWIDFQDIKKRVKCIDGSDIESLGFNLEMRTHYCFHKNGSIWISQNDNGSYVITDEIFGTMFSGFIKNKWELKRILKTTWTRFYAI